MNEEELQQNCQMRWEKLKVKKERYGEAWRSYPLQLLMTLSLHRMTEVVEVYKSTGVLDVDNLVDAMNFADMVIIKAGKTIK